MTISSKICGAGAAVAMVLTASIASAQIAPCAGMIVRAPPAMDASDERPLGTMRATPTNPVHCTTGVALPVTATITLWRCQTEPPEDETGVADAEWSHAFLIEREGEALQYYRDEVMAGALDAWRVVDADLDGDGTSEHVVALWTGQGNGLGISRWTLHVFNADWRLLGTREEVADWGRSAIIAAPGGRPGCDMLLTDYVEDAPAPGREGLALEAKFLGMVDGLVVEVDDRPLLRRRLDTRFQRQRALRDAGAGWEIESDVAAWLEPVSGAEAARF